MMEARTAMGKVLSSSRNFPKKRKSEDTDQISMLIVLDDLTNEADCEWFAFQYRGEKEMINDVLVTSTKDIDGVSSVPVPPLSEEECIKLVLMESNLQSNHQISSSVELKEIVRRGMFHPLVIKFVGRWMNLKRTTGNKGFDEILTEIKSSMSPSPATPNDALYEVLSQAIAPQVKGKKANTIRLCFASLNAFFSRDFCNPSIPLEVANDFFASVVESKGDALTEDGLLPCPLFKSHGRHAAKLVPEILGALGIFNITKHSTKEKSIQIDHEVICQFGDHVLNDEIMQQVADETSFILWHEMHAKTYFDQYNWNDPRPDRSQTYALQYLPRHMIKAEMLDSTGEILSEKTFYKGRISTFGLEVGTKIHLQDIEAFCTKFVSHNDSYNTALKVCEVMEAVLMRKVDKDADNPVKDSPIIDVGRCLQMMSSSLIQLGQLDDAAKYCDKCVELVYGSQAADKVASLMYNAAILYLEANRFDSAREVMDLVVAMREKLSGDKSPLVARSLSLLGDTFFEESDYEHADSQYKKCISILNSASNDCHLELALAHFKMGRTDYERGYHGDALRNYDQSSKFAKNEGLPPNHELFVNINYRVGNALLKKGSTSDATDVFKQTLASAKEVIHKSHDLVVRVYLMVGALHSINDNHVDAIENYKGARTVLRQHAPNNTMLRAKIMLLIGDEFMKTNDHEYAINEIRESIDLMKQTITEHLDVADALVTLSSLEYVNGKVSLASHTVALCSITDVLCGSYTSCLLQHKEAAHHMEEAVSIQNTKLGNCAKLGINIRKLGSYLKAAGDTDKALNAYTDSLLILTEMKGQKEELVCTLLELAGLLNGTGEFKAALGHYNDCLNIQKSLYTETHEDVAKTLYLIGTVKMNQGRYKKSLAFLDEAIDVMTALNGEVNQFNGNAYNLMGFVEMKNGDPDNSLERLSDALRVRRALGSRSQEAETLKNIGHVYREKNEFDMALEQYEECLCIITEEEGKESEAVVDVLIEMGNVASDMNSHDDAMSHYKNGEMYYFVFQ